MSRGYCIAKCGLLSVHSNDRMLLAVYLHSQNDCRTTVGIQCNKCYVHNCISKDKTNAYDFLCRTSSLLPLLSAEFVLKQHTLCYR